MHNIIYLGYVSIKTKCSLKGGIEMPKRVIAKSVKLPLTNPRKNPHWKELAENVFNQPASGKRHQTTFRVTNPLDTQGREHDIHVLIGKNENRTGLWVYVTGNVAFGTDVPGLGVCGPKNRMKFKIKYDYENHDGVLIVQHFGQ